jgi:hypothetical protein
MDQRREEDESLLESLANELVEDEQVFASIDVRTATASDKAKLNELAPRKKHIITRLLSLFLRSPTTESKMQTAYPEAYQIFSETRHRMQGFLAED